MKNAIQTNPILSNSQILLAEEQQVEEKNATTNKNTIGRLHRGELIKFNIFIKLRTKMKYARFITLIQSKRDKI